MAGALAPAAPRAAAQERPAAEIVHFSPAAGTLQPGDTAESSLVVRNAGGAPALLWVGYSVQDPAGRWHDVAPQALPLAAGAASEPQRMRWVVPAAEEARAGGHRVVMAVWSGRPGAAGAVRLAHADRPGAFRVEAGAPLLLGGVPWRSGDHPLGRGEVRPGNVRVDGGALRLALPAGRCDGAEVMTGERFVHGEFVARLRTPYAPGSLSAFFLYQDVPGANDEIDLEIPNDGRRQAMLTIWVGGEISRQATVRLPFDPADGVHEYTIRREPGRVRFAADGVVLREWRSGLPTAPMRVALNAWWPAWMRCADAAEDRFLTLESVEIREVSAR